MQRQVVGRGQRVATWSRRAARRKVTRIPHSSLAMTTPLALAHAEAVLSRFSEFARSPLVPRDDFFPPAKTGTVTVIVPTYDDSQFLGEALRSLQAQTFEDWTCIVVDDASAHDVDSVLSDFSSDRRIRLVRHGTNAGLAAARNTGLRLAETPFVQFLDADDLLTPWALEDRLSVFADHAKDELVAGVYGQVVQCPIEVGLRDVAKWKGSKALPRRDWLESGGESPFLVHAPLLRTDVARAVRGFDEAFVNGAEDWDFWHRILRHGYVFEPCRSIVGAYRQRPSSMIRLHAGVHFGRADELIRRSGQRAIVAESPHEAGALSLNEAREVHDRMVRVCRWAGLAVANVPEAASVPNSLITPELLDFAPTHLPTRIEQYRDSVRSGLIRGLGLAAQQRSSLSPEAMASLDGIAAVVVEELTRRQRSVESGISQLPEGAIDLTATRTVDVGLVAQTAADVQRLLSASASLVPASASIVAVDLDVVKGNEGAVAAWEESGTSVVSANAVYLGRCRPQVVIARRPLDPATRELIETAKQWGAACYVLGEDRSDLELLDNPSADFVVPEATADAISLEFQRSVSLEPLSGGAFSFALVREETPQDPRGAQTLAGLRDAFSGKTVVVIGNGPSLNQTDLSLLEGTPTFGVNSIFLADQRLPEPLTFFVVEDTAVFDDNEHLIKRYQAQHRFFPSLYRNRFSASEIGDNTHFFRMNMGFYGRGTGTVCHPRFSFDAGQRLFCGQSVTIINLQLAHWMGFSRVVLIGMDFSYVIPADAERDGNSILSRSDDPNHFHPDYFGAGKTWKDPKLDRVLANYRLAHDVYRTSGREIINATVGGRLEEFPRLSLAAALGR